MEESRTRRYRWVNQYIERVASRSDRILSLASDEVESNWRRNFEEIRRRYPRLIVEIGSGSGEHCIEQAARDPESLYLGVELRYKRIFRMIEKAETRSVSNLYGLHADANRVPDLLTGIPLHGIYMLFPDPWAKRRWRKHRVATEPWISAMIALLSDGGFFCFKSDRLDYFDEVVSAVRGNPTARIEVVSKDLHREPWAEDNIMSEFEKLFKSQGLPVGYLRATKHLTKL